VLETVVVPLTDFQAVSHILGFAERALAAGDPARAAEVFRDVLVLDPDNDLARRGLAAVQRPPPVAPHDEIRMTTDLASIGAIGGVEAWVVNRLIAGRLRVWKLLEGAPLPAARILEAIDSLSRRGVLAAEPL
jgi:hypothetical protein